MAPASVLPSADSARQDRRQTRYGARHVLWDLSTLKRVRHCGRYARSDAGVGVRRGEDGYGFANVQTCGSVWACPVCSAKIAHGRQGDIEAALTEWHRRGGRVALVTLTMRHRRGQALSDLWDGVADAWHRATSGGAWKADQDHYGVPMSRLVRSGRRAGQTVVENRLRTIRVVEVTHGDNGWHVHVHALVLLGAASSADVDRIASGMFDRWSSSLVAAGFAAPIMRHGVDARLLQGDPSAALGEYFTKGVYSASLEVARGDLKDGRHGSRTPFGILRGLVEVYSTGDLAGRDGLPEVSADEAAWREWEAGSKGRRQVAWTVGLRAELLPDAEPELTDEELAEQDQGGEEAGRIEPATWSEITRHRADWRVLAAFNRDEAEGWAEVAVYAVLADARESAASRGHGRLTLPRPDWRRRPRV